MTPHIPHIPIDNALQWAHNAVARAPCRLRGTFWGNAMGSNTRGWESFPYHARGIMETGAAKRLVIECDDAKDAVKMMGKLNAFKGAVYREAKTNMTMQFYADLCRRVHLGVKGSNVIAMPRDLEPDNLKMARALGIEAEMRAALVDPYKVAPPEDLIALTRSMDARVERVEMEDDGALRARMRHMFGETKGDM